MKREKENARAPLHGVRAVTAERQSRERDYYSTGIKRLSSCGGDPPGTAGENGGPMRASAPTEKDGGAGDG